MKKALVFILISISLFIIINTVNYKSNTKYSMDKNLIKQVSNNVPNYTPLDKIPKDLINAVISAEDKRFFLHQGFDLIAITRSMLTDIKEMRFKSGGSTITQQLAKNLFLSNEKNLTRKLKELFFAIKLEQTYSKEQILEMYLNIIYYGSGAYGIQNASMEYFNKNVSELSLEESAMLAGLPQSPSRYNPKKYFKRAKKRQEVILNRMSKNGFINKETKKQTLEQMLLLVQ